MLPASPSLPQPRRDRIGTRALPYVTIAEAAGCLGVTPTALRARCRRAARPVDGHLVADLGVCVARKFGATWRLRFVP